MFPAQNADDEDPGFLWLQRGPWRPGMLKELKKQQNKQPSRDRNFIWSANLSVGAQAASLQWPAACRPHASQGTAAPYLFPLDASRRAAEMGRLAACAPSIDQSLRHRTLVMSQLNRFQTLVAEAKNRSRRFPG